MRKNVIDMYPECNVKTTSYKVAGLRDKDDEHILAAAVQAQASYLLTYDEVLLKETLPLSYEIKLLSPDDFLIEEALLRGPKAVFDATESHRKSLIKSNPSREQYIESLDRAGLVKFSRVLKRYQFL